MLPTSQLVRRSVLTVDTSDQSTVSGAWRHNADAIALTPPVKLADVRARLPEVITDVGRGGAEIFVRIDQRAKLVIDWWERCKRRDAEKATARAVARESQITLIRSSRAENQKWSDRRVSRLNPQQVACVQPGIVMRTSTECNEATLI